MRTTQSYVAFEIKFSKCHYFSNSIIVHTCMYLQCICGRNHGTKKPQLHKTTIIHTISHAHTHMHTRTPLSLSLTIALELLSEYAVHDLPTHVAEGGGQEGVVLEPMGDIYLEPLLQILNSKQQQMATTRIYSTARVHVCSCFHWLLWNFNYLNLK